MPKEPKQSPVQQAVAIARRTSLLPTALSAKDTANLAANLQRRVFWSARWTNEAALKEMQKLVIRATKGEGYENDLPQLRIEARAILKAYGYTAERGFKGDAKRGVPSATKGTLRDLMSEVRLNLIFRTQAAIARGLGRKLRGLARIRVAPAWRFKRLSPRDAPRDWETRWIVAGDAVKWVGVYNTEDGEMIARKDSPIWAALGSRALFEDALNNDHEPYALNSGWGREEMMKSELKGLRLVNDHRKPNPDAPTIEIEAEPLPTPEEALSQVPELKPSPEEAPEYVSPDDFIGGQKTVDSLLEMFRVWKKKRGL